MIVDPVHSIQQYIADPTLERRNEVVTAYWYLCARGAKKFLRPESERADLEQVAAIGLIKACEYYRSSYQTPFEAYAWMMIVGELMHYVRDHERIVRLPRWLRSLERRYLSAYDVVVARTQCEPTLAQLAQEMETTAEIVAEIRTLRGGRNIVSLDGDANGSPVSLERYAVTAERTSVDEQLVLLTVVEELPEAEKIVVLGTYGAGLTQSELGTRLGVSQRQVSRILARAISRMSKSLRLAS